MEETGIGCRKDASGTEVEDGCKERMRKRSQKRRRRHNTGRSKRQSQWQRTSSVEGADVQAAVMMRLVFPELGGGMEAGHAAATIGSPVDAEENEQGGI